MWGRTKLITKPAIDVRTTTALPVGDSVGAVLPHAAGDGYDKYWLLVGFNGGVTPTVDLVPFIFEPKMPATPTDTRWCGMPKHVGIPAPDATGTLGQLIELPPIPPSATRIYLRATDISDSTASHDLLDATNIIASADATDLATGITLGNESKAVLNAHDTDAGTVFHFAAGGGHQVTAVNADTLEAELVTLCVDIQTIYAAHLADATVHDPADATNTTGAVSITDTATCNSFLNDMKAKYNLHRVFAGPENIYGLLVAAEETK